MTLGIGRMTYGAVRVWLRLDGLVVLMVALWFYAPAAVVVLVIADVVLIRPHLRGGGRAA